jgi:hypothetical protein
VLRQLKGEFGNFWTLIFANKSELNLSREGAEAESGG